MTDTWRFRPNQRVGPYQLVRPLGLGSYAEVWLAHWEAAVAAPPVAVKLPHAAVDFDAVRREAVVWARLTNHPNVLRLFVADRFDGQIAIVSEYAADGSLKDWWRRPGGTTGPAAALDLTAGVLDGLGHLHAQGVIHRDVKPENILIQYGTPRLADFGIAWDGAAGRDVLGTPAYMAPEAFAGDRSVQTDLWSVGVVLYELLTGCQPFPARDLADAVWRTTSTDPPPLPGSVPGPVREVVRRALAKRPTDRYATAAEMRVDVRRAQSQPAAPAAVAVAGPWMANGDKVADRLDALARPYLGAGTTWYCGSSGVAAAAAIRYLHAAGERVVVVADGDGDYSSPVWMLVSRHGLPTIDARSEVGPGLPPGLSPREAFFARRADLMVVIWDGSCARTGSLLRWVWRQSKPHLVGYL